MLLLSIGLSINNYVPQTWKLLVSADLFLSQPTPHQIAFRILGVLWYCHLYNKWDWLETKAFPELIFFPFVLGYIPS